MKNYGSFHISAQNIDCGYPLEPPHLGGSYEYPQSMFLSINKKNTIYPCKPQFYCINVGKLWFKGFIMKTRLFKYIENFTTKNWKLPDKNSDIFFIFLLKT